jgi:hypothetical protein
MIRCQSCGTENLDNSQYCDECGARLSNHAMNNNNKHQQAAEAPVYQPANVTSVGVPAFAEEKMENSAELRMPTGNAAVRATLVIERGTAVGTEFNLTAEESYIGRWDADNGIFPDVDLDAFDTEAKVSRRHARILCSNGAFSIEDLGSTNGTYVNRGRRLIPGSPQKLDDGDEIIVGKTFLRFYINN